MASQLLQGPVMFKKSVFTSGTVTGVFTKSVITADPCRSWLASEEAGTNT
jgi:hypothetical protein